MINDISSLNIIARRDHHESTASVINLITRTRFEQEYSLPKQHSSDPFQVLSKRNEYEKRTAMSYSLSV